MGGVSNDGGGWGGVAREFRVLVVVSAHQNDQDITRGGELFKRFQSQGQGHRNEHEYMCVPCMCTVMRSLKLTIRYNRSSTSSTLVK